MRVYDWLWIREPAFLRPNLRNRGDYGADKNNPTGERNFKRKPGNTTYNVTLQLTYVKMYVTIKVT